MSKPIAVIYFPENYISGGMERNWIYEYMAFLNGQQNDGSKWKWNGYFATYYWFCFYKSDIDAPEFHVFHPKDFTDIQLKELQEIVYNSIKINTK